MNLIARIIFGMVTSAIVVNLFYFISIPFHALFNSTGTISYSKTGSMRDMESNQYKTVTIDRVEWTAENLKTSKFADGREIFHATNFAEWDSANKYKIPAWAHIDFDTAMDDKYGKLYNYYVVADKGGIAPPGWRIPAFNDYFKMLKFVKTEFDLGTQRKNYPEDVDGDFDAENLRSEKVGWNFICGLSTYSLENKYPIDKGTNESGFSALPGGIIISYGESSSFLSPPNVSGWWARDRADLFITDHEYVTLQDATDLGGFYIRLIR